MKNTITNGQIYFILNLGLFKTLELPKYMAQTSGRSSWIIIMITAFVFGIAGAVIGKLNSTYQNEVFFDYSQKITGKFFAYIFAFYYIIYYFIFCNYFNLRAAVFIESNLLPKTPQYVIIFLSILCLVYISYKGIQNIARMAQILGLALAISILIFLAMLFKGAKENILPLLNFKELNLESFKYTIPSFGGIEFLLMIPFTKQNRKPAINMFLIILSVGLFYLTYTELTMMVLGVNNTMILNDCFLEAMRILDLNMIERIDVFIILIYFIVTFFSLIIMFTGIIEYTCKIFSKINHKIIAVFTGITAYLFFLFTMNLKGLENIYELVLSILVIISCMIIPISIYIISILKKRLRIEGNQ